MSTLQVVRKYEPGQIGLIGEEIYRREIRPKVYPQYKEQFLALDVETHEYEIDPDADVAATRLQARRPGAPTYVVRIGYQTAHTLVGGGMKEDEE